MRAVMQNRQLAAASGIGTAGSTGERSSSAPAWPASPASRSPCSGSVGPTLGTNYIVDAFLVVIVGGLGKLRGAVIAAFASALINSLGGVLDTSASLAKVIVFVCIVAFLQFRPQGIVAQQSRGLA